MRKSKDMTKKCCPVCHKTFDSYDKSPTTYCSLPCYHKSKRKITNNGIVNICSRCKKEKPVSDFGNSKHKFSGLMSWCRQCYRERAKKMYSYKCVDCGNTFKRTALIAKNKEYRCIHCAQHKIMSEHGGNTVNYTGTKNFAGRTYSTWRTSAKRRGYVWELTKDMLEKQYKDQNGICALSGIKMEPMKKSPYRPSIDRIDSSNGYVAGNCQFVCSMVNVMKNKFNEENFVRVCGLISAYKTPIKMKI